MDGPKPRLPERAVTAGGVGAAVGVAPRSSPAAGVRSEAGGAVRPIRVLVADDHRIVREGLVSLLSRSGQCEVVAEAADGREAVERAAATRPDVAVVDLSMPAMGGIEVVHRLRERSPETVTLVLTVHDEAEYVLPAVRAGAAGYLVKDSAAADLLAAVRALAAGDGWFGPQPARVLADRAHRPGRRPDDPYDGLTPREREVFRLIVEGRSTREIGSALGISFKTAEKHRGRLMAKLGLRRTADLVRYAARRQPLPPE